MLHSNCVLFNREDSPIVQLAQKLMDMLLAVSSGVRYEAGTINGLGAALVGEELTADAGADADADAEMDGDALQTAGQGQEKSGLMLKLKGRSDSYCSEGKDAISSEMDINEVDGEASEAESVPTPSVSIKLRARKRDESSSAESEDAADVPHASQRNIPHRTTKPKPSQKRNAEVSDQSASASESDYASSEDADEGEYQRPTRRGRAAQRSSAKPQKKKARVAEPTRASSRSRSRRTSFAHSESDEKSSEDEEPEIEHYRPPARGGRKSSGKAPVPSPATKKEKAGTGSKAGAASASASAPASSSKLSGDDIYDNIMWPSFNIIVAEDSWELFAQPVTDEIAPGYSKEITRPTDLNKIRFVLLLFCVLFSSFILL
jgi:hypothetical protein